MHYYRRSHTHCLEARAFDHARLFKQLVRPFIFKKKRLVLLMVALEAGALFEGIPAVVEGARATKIGIEPLELEFLPVPRRVVAPKNLARGVEKLVQRAHGLVTDLALRQKHESVFNRRRD